MKFPIWVKNREPLAKQLSRPCIQTLKRLLIRIFGRPKKLTKRHKITYTDGEHTFHLDVIHGESYYDLIMQLQEEFAILEDEVYES